MKRTATLVAGLLLVTGTVFAEVKVTAAHVEGTYWLTNSQTGSFGSKQDNDLDLEVKAEKTGDFGTVGLVLQNDKDDDTDLRVTYTKTAGDFTVATEALLIDSDGQLLGENAEGGTAGANMNKGDGTYISWDVMGSKTFKLTYYPYEVGGMSFDKETFESFVGYANPGMKLDVKVNPNTNLAFRFVTDNGKDGETEKNKYTYKVDLDTKVGKAEIKAAAGMGEVTKSYLLTDNLVKDIQIPDVLGPLALAASYEKEGSFVAAQLKMPIAKFTVLAEANTEAAEFSTLTGVNVFEINRTGLYLKGSYDMGTYNKYVVTPYASAEVTDVEFKYANGSKVDDRVTELEAGIALKQGSFTVTPKVEIKKAKTGDLAGYDKEDSTDTKKKATAVGVKFAYSM